MNMKRIKKQFVREILALDSLNQGDRNPAVEALQLANLTDAQLRYGLESRIRDTYSYFTACRRKVAAFFMGSATTVLSGGRLSERAPLEFFVNQP